MRLGKYEVWITSKGKRLSEYNTEGYENEIICYIESQVGQTLAIHWKDNHRPRTMSCEVTVFLDGVMVDETVYQHDVKGRNVGVVDSIWVDEHTLREIVFAKTIASDSEDRVGHRNHRALNEWTGKILVSVDRVIVVDEEPWGTQIQPFDLKLSGPTHEDEKAPNHVLELGDEIKEEVDASNLVYLHTTSIRRNPERPDFLFTFIYMPREELQALGIVGPNKRPSAPQSSRERKRVKAKRSKSTIVPEVIEISSDSENEDKGQGSSDAMVRLPEQQQRQIAAQQAEIEAQRLELQKERLENQKKFD